MTQLIIRYSTIACALLVFLLVPVFGSRLQAAESEVLPEPQIVVETPRLETRVDPQQGLSKPTVALYSSPPVGGALDPLAARLAIDLKDLVQLPMDASGKAWGKFGLGLALIGAFHSIDESVRTGLDSSGQSSSAKLIRPLGQEGGVVFLGSSFVIGRLANKPKAVRIGRDGLEAVVLSAGVLVPLVKDLVGRERPRKDLGSGVFGETGQSFPSGEVTQAFAIASVVSAHSDRKWVKGLAWTLASGTAWQRMELDAHWASDVVAGALLGAAVGRWVVRRNNHSVWTVEPRIEEDGAGVILRCTF